VSCLCLCAFVNALTRLQLGRTERTIGSSDSQAPPFPSLTTRSQAATDTGEATTLATNHSADNAFCIAGSGTSKNVGAPLPSATESPTDTTASKSLAIPSANNVCCDAGSSASENVGSLGTQVSSSTASPTAGTTVPKASAALSADNACRDAGSNASENVGPQVPSSTASPTADTTVSKSLEAPSADNASRIASPGTSENVGAQILDATESSTAGAMSASLTTSPADANNACCDAGSGTSKNLNGKSKFECLGDMLEMRTLIMTQGLNRPKMEQPLTLVFHKRERLRVSILFFRFETYLLCPLVPFNDVSASVSGKYEC
jgi:hypothetical protein